MQLKDLTENQKMSFINALINVTSQNTNINYAARTNVFLEYCDLFDVYIENHLENSIDYFSEYGEDRMIEDLRKLTNTQKDLLVNAVIEAMKVSLFEGTDDDKWVAEALLVKIHVSVKSLIHFISIYSIPKNNFRINPNDENISKTINLAQNVNYYFLEDPKQTINFMEQLYEFIRVKGCKVFLGMSPLDCQVVGLAFARMALVYRNGDNDINSVAAENAFYCLAKSYLEADNTFTLPAIFTLLNMSPELLASKFMYGLETAINIADELHVNNEYLFKSSNNPFDLCKYYLVNIFYDIDNNKFNIPEDLPYLLPKKDYVTEFLINIDEKIGKNSIDPFFAGKLIFNCVYIEIEDTLMKF